MRDAMVRQQILTNNVVNIYLKNAIKLLYLKCIISALQLLGFIVKDNPRILSWKIKKGAVLIAIISVLYGCKSGNRGSEATCYEMTSPTYPVENVDSLMEEDSTAIDSTDIN
jgi:hypothetical protein